MALKLGPGTTLPPQHSAVAALPPQVVTGAIDCTEISPSLPPAVIATSVPQTKPVAASLESSKKPEKPKGPGYLTTRPLSSVKACEVHYLWKPYLPAGELAILSGDPGVGKTWIAQGISADLTRGRIPFTHAPRPPAAVLYLTVENSPEELRRRFTSQGGNLDLLHIVDDPVRLSDIESLDGALQETKPALMVVDPIQSFLGPVDTYRANKIRPVLDGLALLAKKHGCCILLLRHLTKGATGRGIYRGSGGIDLSAAARSELLAGHAANDPEQYALVHTKTNLGPKGVSLGYSIGESFSWTGVSKLTERDLLAPESHRAEGGAISEAKQFLFSTLAEGPRKAGEVHAEAQEAGIKPATLTRAKGELGVESKKCGLSAGWMWLLPDGDHLSHAQKP